MSLSFVFHVLSRDFPKLEARSSQSAPTAPGLHLKARKFSVLPGRVTVGSACSLVCCSFGPTCLKFFQGIHIVSVDGLAKLVRS